MSSILIYLSLLQVNIITAHMNTVTQAANVVASIPKFTSYAKLVRALAASSLNSENFETSPLFGRPNIIFWV